MAKNLSIWFDYKKIFYQKNHFEKLLQKNYWNIFFQITHYVTIWSQWSFKAFLICAVVVPPLSRKLVIIKPSSTSDDAKLLNWHWTSLWECKLGILLTPSVQLTAKYYFLKKITNVWLKSMNLVMIKDSYCKNAY